MRSATMAALPALSLLANAYAGGGGVAAEERRARELLERATEHASSAATRQLAFVKQTGDAPTPRDPAEARQLPKEAEEHRRSNARRFRGLHRQDRAAVPGPCNMHLSRCFLVNLLA